MAASISGVEPNVILRMEQYEKEIVARFGEEKFATMNIGLECKDVIRQVSKFFPQDQAVMVNTLIVSLDAVWKPSMMMAIIQKIAELDFIAQSDEKEGVAQELKSIENLLLQNLKMIRDDMFDGNA